MRKNYKLVFPLLSLLCFLLPNATRATHVMGADITWKCLGNDSFELIVHAYRDCNGIQLGGTDLTYQTTGDTCVTIPVNANPDVCCGTDITPVCKRSCDRCEATTPPCSFPYGIEQWTITAVVYLPPPCCNYTIAWQENARSSLITTGAANASFYDEVYLNRCIKPCVSSPYFTIPPVGIFCTNQCIVYNPGVDDNSRDAEGRADSLVYSFGIPYSSQGNSIPYLYPYTNDAPLIYAGSSKNEAFIPPTCYGFHLDSTTGDIEFKALKPDQTVFVIVVDIYRRDSLGVERKIGEIKRDMEIIIMDCPANHPPIIPGINGGTTYSEKICADQQTCFQVKAFDLDLPDTDYLSWNNPGTMTGASFTVVPNGQKWPTAVFCWYPTDKDVRSYPYTFIATAIDNACPVPGRASRAFSVYVIAAPSANYSAIVQKCGMVYFQASPSKSSSTTITNYLWSGEGSPGHSPLYKIGKTASYQYNSGGTYHYNLVVTGPNGCTRTYSDSVTIAPFPGISLPKDTQVCNNSPTITVTAKTINAYKPYNIWWNFKDKKGDSLTTISITETITHDTTFRVNIFDEGCPNFDSMKVKVIPLPKPNIGADKRGCWGKGVMLTTGLKHMPVTNWTWINGKDTVNNQLKGDTIIVGDSGIYTVSVQDSIGCPGNDTVNVFFNPLVQVLGIDTTVCVGDSVTLKAGIGGQGASYTWMDQIHNNKIVNTDPIYKFAAIGSSGYGKNAFFKVVIKQTGHGLTCSDTGYFKVVVNTPSHPILDSLKPKCIDDPPYKLGNTPPWVDAGHQGGTWYYPRKPSAIVDNFLYPSNMGRTDNDHTLGWVHYLFVNEYKCVTDDSAHINISLKPQVTAGPDTTICTANGKYLLSNNSVSPAGGLWFALKGTPNGAISYSKNRDSVLFDPNYQGITDTVYGIIYSYQDQAVNGKSSCSNSDTVYLRVRSNPVVTVIPADSLCMNAGPVQFTSMSPQNGIWKFASGDITNPHALRFDKYSQTYSFIADSAGPGWHYLTYTAFGDLQGHMCPTTKKDSMYVVPAPQNVDFHTADTLWEYCVNHSKVALVPTSAGKTIAGGSFVAGREVYESGKNYYFDPSLADTVNSNPVLYILYYNHNQCHVSVSHDVKVDGRPFVTFNSVQNVCANQVSFEMKATKYNATGLIWSADGVPYTGFINQNGDSTEVSYSPTNTQILNGKFTISVKASKLGNCAPYTASKSFIISQPPVIKFTSPRDGCEPLPIHFNADSVMINNITIASDPSQMKRIDWDFGDGSSHSQQQNPYHVYKVTNGKDTQQFDVTLTVTSDSGCEGSLTKKGWITAYATPKPVISANPQFTTIALPQIQFTLDTKSTGIDFSDPKTTYRWSFGDNSPQSTSYLRNPVHTYGDTGTYRVWIQVNSKGCTGDTFLTVYVQPELIIYIPNVFKPDNHHPIRSTLMDEPNYFDAEVNNTFQPVISDYATFQMSIYNRWGQLMYSTNDPGKGWDGWYQGHEPVQDAYVYVIKATSYSGKPYTFTGTVTLVY